MKRAFHGRFKIFSGCISKLVINGKDQIIAPSLVRSHGITGCETCVLNPCDNGGLCQEDNTVQGHRCICQPGYSGESCEKVGDACYEGKTDISSIDVIFIHNPCITVTSRRCGRCIRIPKASPPISFEHSFFPLQVLLQVVISHWLI